MTVTVDLLEWGAPAVIDTPTIEETIRISSISRLMTELARAFPMPARPGVAVPGSTPSVPPEQPIPAEQPAPEEVPA